MIRLFELAEFSSDAAFAIDEQGRVVAWNRRAQELLGYEASEVLGRRCGDILNGVYSTGAAMCALCDCMKCFETGDGFSARDCRLQHKHGHRISADVSSLVSPPTTRSSDDEDAMALILLRPTRSKTSTMSSLPLRIFALGHFGLTLAGNAVATNKWKRRHALAALKCLVCNAGCQVNRDQLIEHLWPGVEAVRGWGRLKVTMSFLRNELEAAGLPRDFVQTVDQSYVLHSDGIWIDAEIFEKQSMSALQLAHLNRPEQALQCCEEARRLYRGEFLPDDLYEDWYAQRRASLRELHFKMLECMANCLDAIGDPDRAGQIRQENWWQISDEIDDLRVSARQRLQAEVLVGN